MLFLLIILEEGTSCITQKNTDYILFQIIIYSQLHQYQTRTAYICLWGCAYIFFRLLFTWNLGNSKRNMFHLWCCEPAIEIHITLFGICYNSREFMLIYEVIEPRLVLTGSLNFVYWASEFQFKIWNTVWKSGFFGFTITHLFII